MAEPLFRPEVTEQDQQRLLGTISLAQPMAIHVWITGLVVIVIAVLIFVLNSNYQRKEQVRGALVPDRGLLRIRTDQAGVVSKVHVNEGQTIREGDALLTIVNQRSNQQGSDLSHDLQRKVQERIDLTREQLQGNARLSTQELFANQQQLRSLRKQAKHLSEQLKLSKQRLASQLTRLNDQKQLVTKGHLPRASYVASQEAYLSEEIAMGHLHQQLLQIEQEQALSEAEAVRIPLRHQVAEQNALKAITELEQQLREIEAGFERVIRASHAGEVTAVQVTEGETVTSLSSLMTIIPIGSRLVAELLLPSRSIGLVQVGDAARLRLDAFPYQQFGLIAAEVLHVDETILMPNSGRQIQEPVYRVRAFLNTQQLEVDGDSYRLRAGMLVEADLLQERRKLVDWLLAPMKGLQKS